MPESNVDKTRRIYTTGKKRGFLCRRNSMRQVNTNCLLDFWQPQVIQCVRHGGKGVAEIGSWGLCQTSLGSVDLNPAHSQVCRLSKHLPTPLWVELLGNVVSIWHNPWHQEAESKHWSNGLAAAWVLPTDQRRTSNAWECHHQVCTDSLSVRETEGGWRIDLVKTERPLGSFKWGKMEMGSQHKGGKGAWCKLLRN